MTTVKPKRILKINLDSMYSAFIKISVDDIPISYIQKIEISASVDEFLTKVIVHMPPTVTVNENEKDKASLENYENRILENINLLRDTFAVVMRDGVQVAGPIFP